MAEIHSIGGGDRVSREAVIDGLNRTLTALYGVDAMAGILARYEDPDGDPEDNAELSNYARAMRQQLQNTFADITAALRHLELRRY